VSSDRHEPKRWLDLLVYVPAGLWESATEDFGALADRGRQRVEGQLRTARLVGRLALETARRRVEEALGALTPPVRGGPEMRKVIADTPRAESPDGRTAEAGQRHRAREATDGTATDSVPSVNGRDPAKELAIPGYDSLSASQVVQRLGGLSRGELGDVKAHELTHRHRRTILNRVDQLLCGDGPQRP
jgi:hypothetical protein